MIRLYLDVSRVDNFSPYKSLPIPVLFGVDRQRYYIQDALLRKLENLPIRSPWTSEMIIEDVDADIGHIVIHFLHTGDYQTLDETDGEHVEAVEENSATTEFQKAVRACKVATKYGMPDLQQLAQAEMDRWGANMNLHDAIGAISQDSVAKSLDENTWLQEYVSQKVRSAFELDSDVFLEEGFFERISSHTLTKVLAKNMVSLYNERVLTLQKEKVAEGTAWFSGKGVQHSSRVDPEPQRLTSDCPARNAGVWTESQDKVDLFDDPSVVKDSHILDDDKPSIPEAEAEEATRVEATEATLSDAIPASVELETVNSAVVLSETAAEKNHGDSEWIGWGSSFISSNKDKKKKKKKDPICDLEVPVSEIPIVEPEPELTTEPPLPELAPEPALAVEQPSTKIQEDGWGDWGASATKKKKKKKKLSEAVYEILPPMSEAAPGSDLIEPIAIVEDADDAKSTAQTAIASENDECRWRMEHLFENDGWRTCKPCLARMRGMASQLQAVDLSEMNGFGRTV